MMQKSCKIITIALLSCTFFVLPAQAVPTASLKLLDDDIIVGESFGVEVWADGDGIGLELLAFGMDIIETGGGVFTRNSTTLNPQFDDDTLFGSPMNVAGSAFPGIPDDDVLLVTLNYTALAEGSGTIAIRGIYDGAFSGLYYATPEFLIEGFDIDDVIALNVSAPVPEPATAILVGLGVLSLIVWRKRYLES